MVIADHTILEHLGNLGVITFAVVSTSWVHFSFLKWMNASAQSTPRDPRLRLPFGVVGAVIAHSVEVAIFALCYRFSIESGFGSLEGEFQGTLPDFIYFSYAAFTTVGFGDITPTGPLRLLAGVEALTGFVLITWTASYLYLEMERFWKTEA